VQKSTDKLHNSSVLDLSSITLETGHSIDMGEESLNSDRSHRKQEGSTLTSGKQTTAMKLDKGKLFQSLSRQEMKAALDSANAKK